MKKNSNNIKTALIKSVLLHIGILSLLIGNYWLPWWDAVDLVDVKLIESSIRVDVVDMPDKTLKELKLIDLSKRLSTVPKEKVVADKKAPKKEAIENESDAKNELKVVDTSKSLQDMLKDFSKRDVKPSAKPKNDLDKDKNKKEESDLGRLIVSGNKLSEGSKLTGDTISENLSPLDAYGEILLAKIRPYWRLPPALSSLNLKSRIRIFIAADGGLLKYVMTQSSGNSEFDERTIEAVTRAAPFPTPDAKIRDQVYKGVLVLGFPLQ